MNLKCLRKSLPAFLPILLLAMVSASCSSGFATSPGQSTVGPDRCVNNPHHLWGLWTVYVDANAGTIQAVPQRQTELRVNVLPFLEPPALEYLKIDFSDLQIIPPTGGEDGRILVDVLLTHPFEGLTEFTGFDVKGIVFGPTIDNRDGTTRWWNPPEFYGDGMFGFQPGLLGNPDTHLFTETLNDYKYFCEGLGENDDLSDPAVIADVISQRGHFQPGHTLSRHYELNFGPGPSDFFVFQYAVDASWVFPQGNPPWELEDFPPDANQPEAWNITIAEIENTLEYYDGTDEGDLTLHVAVYDWQGCNDTEVTLICDEAGVFDPVTSISPVSEFEDYAIFELAVTDATPNHAGDLPLTIVVESNDVTYNYGGGPGTNPDENITAYWYTSVNVEEGTGPSECDGSLHAEQGWDTNLWLDYSSFETTWDISFIRFGAHNGMYIFPFDFKSP